MSAKTFNLEQLKGVRDFYELDKEFFTKNFTLKDLDISSRVLQHWSVSGILQDNDRKVDENHKFSFVELIWLKIILELRLLGYSIPKIKTAKSYLLKNRLITEQFNLKTDDEIISFNRKIFGNRMNEKEFHNLFSNELVLNNIRSKKMVLLNFLIQIYLLERQNINLIFFNSGEAGCLFENMREDEEVKRLLESQPYIILPMNKLIKDFIDDKRNGDFVSQSHILNKNEIQILGAVRLANFDSIVIHFKNKQPMMIEGRKKIKVEMESRISEILLNRSYEKIEINSQDGNISYSTKTIKFKL